LSDHFTAEPIEWSKAACWIASISEALQCNTRSWPKAINRQSIAKNASLAANSQRSFTVTALTQPDQAAWILSLPISVFSG